MDDSMVLAHHGVKGMKWGVRRSPAQLGHPTSARKTLISTKKPQIPFGSKTEWTEKKTPFGARSMTPAKQARLDRKNALKNRRIMSTEELKERVARLETEKRLRELTQEDLYPGRKAVNEALVNIGKKVVTTAATGAALYYLKYKASGDKKINRQELANAVFNGGPKKK